MTETKPEDRMFQFHLEEFKQLKAEIHQHQKFEFAMEFGAATAAFGVMGFLVNQAHQVNAAGAVIAWWVPLTIVVIARILTKALNNRDRQIGAYIKAIERQYAVTGLGWESYLHPDLDTRRSMLTPKKRWFWTALYSVCVLAGLIMTSKAASVLVLGLMGRS